MNQSKHFPSYLSQPHTPHFFSLRAFLELVFMQMNWGNTDNLSFKHRVSFWICFVQKSCHLPGSSHSEFIGLLTFLAPGLHSHKTSQKKLWKQDLYTIHMLGHIQLQSQQVQLPLISVGILSAWAGAELGP